MQKRLSRLAPLMAMLLLAGMGVARLSRAGLEDAAPYHRRVREAARRMPQRVGPWVSESIEPPEEAVEMLQPNVLVSRAYHNRATGETAKMLLVQCTDARDLIGHYPPVCYPAAGWLEQHAEPRVWRVGGTTLAGMSYLFRYQAPQGVQRMIVYNFLVLPSGSIVRDMEAVRGSAADYTSHFFGAAQVQLVMSPELSRARRDEIFHTLMSAQQGVIQALRSAPLGTGKNR